MLDVCFVYKQEIFYVSLLKFLFTIPMTDLALTADLTNGYLLQRQTLLCEQFYSYALFTPPTWTRQNCLVLSCLQLCSHGQQESFVLSRSNFQLIACSHRRHRWDKTVLSCLQLCSHRRCGQDKTVLSCLQLCSHHRRGQDKTVLSCLCQRREQAIRAKLRSKGEEVL